MSRRSLLAAIHIAKKVTRMCTGCNRLFFGELCPSCGARGRPMEEWEYRQFLSAVTGEDSCSHADDEDLRKVLDLFDRAGFRDAYPYASPQKSAWRARQGTIAQIHRRAHQVFGLDGNTRIEGFMRKVIGKQDLKFCDEVELRRIIGWINRTAKSQQKGDRK